MKKISKMERKRVKEAVKMKAKLKKEGKDHTASTIIDTSKPQMKDYDDYTPNLKGTGMIREIAIFSGSH